MPVQRILVGFDGSRHAARALELACTLASLHGARLFVLGIREPGGTSPDLASLARVEHVADARRQVPSPNIARMPGWMMGAVEAAGRSGESVSVADSLMAQVLQRAHLEARSRGVEDVVLMERSGDAAAEILHCVQEVDADTVVLGNRGLGELKSAVLGSVSHEVAAKAPRSCTCVIVSAPAAAR